MLKFDFIELLSITSILNNTIFLIAVIAILGKLYSTLILSKTVGYKYITSFYALILTVIVILSSTLILIQSNDAIRWQFGFLVWLIYISAILIIFTVVEALFSFERDPTDKSLNKNYKNFLSHLSIFSIIYNLFSAYFSIETWLLIEHLNSVNSNLYLLDNKILSNTSLFSYLSFNFTLTPKLYILSGILQGLALIIVVKILR